MAFHCIFLFPGDTVMNYHKLGTLKPQDIHFFSTVLETVSTKTVSLDKSKVSEEL